MDARQRKTVVVGAGSGIGAATAADRHDTVDDMAPLIAFRGSPAAQR